MDISLQQKINNCRLQILENNKILTAKTKENERLFQSLMSMLNTLPTETKERYDRELASDNYKKYLGNSNSAYIKPQPQHNK